MKYYIFVYLQYKNIITVKYAETAGQKIKLNYLILEIVVKYKCVKFKYILQAKEPVKNKCKVLTPNKTK